MRFYAYIFVDRIKGGETRHACFGDYYRATEMVTIVVVVLLLIIITIIIITHLCHYIITLPRVILLFHIILPSTGQEYNTAQPRKTLFRFSSHFSSFFTV